MIDTDYPYYPNRTSDELTDSERQNGRQSSLHRDFPARYFEILGVLSARVRAKTPRALSLLHHFARRD